MPRLLTDLAQVHCPHGGTGTSIAGTPYLTVMGAAVLVDGDIGTIAGCAFIQVPCVSYTLRSMGLNATKILGKNAILETDIQLTNTGLPLIIVETRPAMDDSTPAPLPPVLAFNTVTQLPPSAVAVFTAYHEHPMSWSLLLLNSVAGTQLDLTSGLPPAATVAPAGGTWSKPALAVTLTLTAPFMASLGMTITKPHSIWFTATTQRGVSATAELQLTIT